MDLQDAFDAGFETVKAYVDAHLAALEKRIASLEMREPEKGEKGDPGADGRDGIDGAPGRDGVDGKDGAPGEKGDPGADGAAGKDGRDGIDGAPGRDGVDGKDGAPGEKGAAGLDGKNGVDGVDGHDGVGLADAFIDRSGALVLTMTDGRTRNLGTIVGRDGNDGADGLGFDDLAVAHDGERGFTFRMARGDRTKEFAFSVPIVMDRGVYREGETYAKGDGVTWAGSYWIAQGQTTEKPDTGKGWRLAVKRGRDGKDAAFGVGK